MMLFWGIFFELLWIGQLPGHADDPMPVIPLPNVEGYVLFGEELP
jgi:hypothetical protein